MVQKQNGVLGVTGCVFCVTNCTRVKALAKYDSYFLNDFSKISILLVCVCLKSFEICRIYNDLRCMQQGCVYGVFGGKKRYIVAKVCSKTQSMYNLVLSMVYVCIISYNC